MRTVAYLLSQVLSSLRLLYTVHGSGHLYGHSRDAYVALRIRTCPDVSAKLRGNVRYRARPCGIMRTCTVDGNVVKCFVH